MLKEVKSNNRSLKAIAAAGLFFASVLSANAGQGTSVLRTSQPPALPLPEMVASAAIGQAAAAFQSLSPRMALLAHMLPFYPAARAGTDGIDRDTVTATVSKLKIDGAATKAKAALTPGVFGSVAIGFGRLPAVAKLAAITGDAKAMTADCKGDACSVSRAAFSAAVDKLRGASFLEKVRSVNTLVNGFVTYRRDADNYGRADYWASPAETLQRRAGDCEDYAILKMATLEKLGIPAGSMSVVILRDDRRNLFHAVLTVRTTKGNFVLDNVRSEVLLDRALAHYTPLYSVSAGKGYIHGRRAADGRTAMSAIRLDSVAPGEGP